MQRFRFEARDSFGSRHRSMVEADGVEQAREKIRSMGLTPGRVVSEASVRGPPDGGYHVPSWRLERDDGVVLGYARFGPTRVVGLILVAMAGGIFSALWLFGAPLGVRIAFGVGLSILGLIGLAMIVTTGRMTVDRITGEFREQTYVGPVALKPVVIEGANVESVQLEVQRTTAGRRNSVFVVLARMKDGRIEELDRSSGERLQREMAEKVARYLDVPLVERDNEGRQCGRAGSGPGGPRAPKHR
jgi:hypothetical protein